jgi:signal transduction histidine kinase
MQLETENREVARERGEFVARILNQRIEQLLQEENRRSFSNYRFIMTVPVIGGEELVLSPLSGFPVRGNIPGLRGYFQIDPEGSFHTPTLPEGMLDQVDLSDKEGRLQLKKQLEFIVGQRDIAHTGVVERVSARDLEAGMSIDSGTIGDPRLERMLAKVPLTPRYEAPTAKQEMVFDVEAGKRGHHGSKRLPLSADGTAMADTGTGPSGMDGGFLNVEIYPFDASIDTRYMIFHRNVLRDGNRHLQGFVVSFPVFFSTLFQQQMQTSSFADLDLRLLFRGSEVMTFSTLQTNEVQEVGRVPLVVPLGDLKLSVGLAANRTVPGAGAVMLLGILFIAGLGGALWGIFRVTHANVAMSRKRADFISAVSHELKTPLTAIRMYCEMLENDFLVSEEKRRRYYQRISSESSRLSRLIQNVLDLSKIERNQWVSELQPWKVDPLVRQFADTFRGSVQHWGCTLDLDLRADDAVHLLDKDAFQQVLVNVVDNAVKFSRDSVTKVIMLTTRQQPDGSLILAVRDYGPGIPAQEMGKVFTVFYRVESEMVRKTSGTGIGLSLVKSLCAFMHIKITMANADPGPGLEVSFLIPPMPAESTGVQKIIEGEGGGAP